MATLSRRGRAFAAVLAVLATASGAPAVVARADDEAARVKKVKDHTGGPLETDEPAATAEEAKGRPAAVRGMQVYVEPQGGKLRHPTREEAEAFAAEVARLTNRSTEGLKAVVREDGTLSMDLQGRFLSVAVATVGPDGKVDFACVHGPEAAAQVASRRDTPAAAPKPTKQDPSPAKAKEALDEY